jgi:hypothetical protein
MSGRSVLRQEVRQDATSTAWTLIWLRHKIHHNCQLFGDFGVPKALQVLDFIGSSGRTRTYNPSVNSIQPGSCRGNAVRNLARAACSA